MEQMYDMSHLNVGVKERVIAVRGSVDPSYPKEGRFSNL